MTFVVWGPIGQACWRLFELCDIGEGGVTRREAVADWVVERLYGYHSARTFEHASSATRSHPGYVPALTCDIEGDPVIQRARRHDLLDHAERHLRGPRGRGADVEGWCVVLHFVRAWYDWYWNIGHTGHMRRQVVWLWEQRPPQSTDGRGDKRPRHR